MPPEAQVGAPSLGDLTRAVARDVRATLAGELGPQPLAELVDEVHALAGSLAESLSARTPADARRLPVCAEGCASCCYVHAVFVTAAEALRIAAHVRATRSAEAVRELRATLDVLAPRVRDMSLAGRARERVACPLLDQARGSCTVHASRPLLCRGYNSCDRGVCDRAFEEGSLAPLPPPASVEQALAHKHVFAGLVLGTGAGGHDAGPYELICALRVALGDDAEARWLAKEPVFDDAAHTRISREKELGWLEFLAREAGGIGG